MKHERIINAIKTLNNAIDDLDRTVSGFDHFIDVIQNGDRPMNDVATQLMEKGESKSFSMGDFLGGAGKEMIEGKTDRINNTTKTIEILRAKLESIMDDGNKKDIDVRN